MIAEFVQTLHGQKPSDFFYTGDYEDFDRWRYTGIGSNRDADILTRSNWEVLSKDLTTRFPDAFIIEEYGHWACGWAEVLRVDTHNDEAVLALKDWKEKLDNYPVADEQHFSDAECDALTASWQSWGRREMEELFDMCGLIFTDDEWNVIEGMWHDEAHGSDADSPTVDEYGLLEQVIEDFGLDVPHRPAEIREVYVTNDFYCIAVCQCGWRGKKESTPYMAMKTIEEHILDARAA